MIIFNQNFWWGVLVNPDRVSFANHSMLFFQKVCPGISDGKMVGTTDLDFHTVIGQTFYTGLLIICFSTATILTIWIKVTNSRCQLPNADDIGIRTTRNLDSILLNIFLVSLIIVNAILFNSYYKGYFLRFILTTILTPIFDSDSDQFWFWFHFNINFNLKISISILDPLKIKSKFDHSKSNYGNTLSFNCIFQSFDGKTWWIPCLVRPVLWSDTATNASFSGNRN